MTEHTAAPSSSTPGYEGWAVVELMGHRRRAGLVREAEMFGTKLLRIDIPAIPTRPALDWDHTDKGYVAFYDAHRFLACKLDSGGAKAEHQDAGSPVWQEAHSTTWNAKQACERRFAGIVPPPPEVPLGELPVMTEFYGGSAIYSLRPCSEAVARAMIERIGDPRPVAPVDYRDGGNGQRQLTHTSGGNESLDE